jgi:hypothetical protein
MLLKAAQPVAKTSTVETSTLPPVPVARSQGIANVP